MTDTAPAASLRLLATTDVHVHLMDYDYYADRPDPDCGLALAATLIAEARAEVANSLLFDNGDFLQGNPLGDFVAQRRMREEGVPHPAIRAMNGLGYDAVALGNHEFNYGLEVLETALAAAEFPVISANILRHRGASPDQDTHFRPPYVILRRAVLCDDGQRRPLAIGVIGFAPPQIVQWDRLLLEGILQTRGIVQAARTFVPLLRAAGADVVVALSHSGLDALDEDPMAEHATAALARVPGIDAIFAGHSHLLFPAPAFAGVPGLDVEAGTAFGVPVAMPGFNAAHLGVIDLSLTHGAAGWQVTHGRATLRPVRGAQPSPAVQRALAEDHAETLRYARATVGETETPLHSYFALIEPSASLRIVAEAQVAHLRNRLAGRPEAALPLLSAVSPFRAGGRGGPENYVSIPAGPLARRNTADLYIYPNTIAALRVTGAELIDWMENSVGLYRQILPGAQDQPLIDPDFPSYNHDRILGLTFAVDLAQPPRFDRFGTLINPGSRRVVNLCHAGQPIDPGAEFVLATNNYRAAGCGGYGAADPSRMIEIGRTPLREVLLAYVSSHPGLYRRSDRNFGFLPMPGSSVTFDTAPAAVAHLDEIAHFRPQPLGLTPQGFARFRLHL